VTATRPPSEALLLRELAERLGVCERQLRKLTKRGLPRLAPRGGRERFGRYPWPEAREWYLTFRRDALAARLEASRRGHAMAKARRREERARMTPTASES
jgi:hypothetical protein